jgi:hypothetical protein
VLLCEFIRDHRHTRGEEPPANGDTLAEELPEVAVNGADVLDVLGGDEAPKGGLQLWGGFKVFGVENYVGAGDLSTRGGCE